MQELEEVGGMEELEKEVNRRIRHSKGSWMIDLIVDKYKSHFTILISGGGGFLMFLTI